MPNNKINVTLKVWRQDGPDAAGHFDTIDAPGINDEMSFLEMLDVVNEDLEARLGTHRLRSRLPEASAVHAVPW
jgi:hypothetical protein